MQRWSELASTASSAPKRWSAAVTCSQRWQSFFGESRSTARRPHRSEQHPLHRDSTNSSISSSRSSPMDPSQRNIMVPESMHAPTGHIKRLTADEIQKRVQKALAEQLKKELLWEGNPSSSSVGTSSSLPQVDDPAHHLARHFLSLRNNPKYRSTRELCLLSGKAFLEEMATKQKLTPKHLLLPRGAEVPEWVDRDQTQVVAVSGDAAEELLEGTDGYVGDFDLPPRPSKEEAFFASKVRMERVLVLDNVTDPGALGTLLRTASSMQYDAVLCVNHCCDLYDHRVVRAAMGAHFQTAVPFFQLREEDGDDTYGVLNHLLRRHEMQPVCFLPQLSNSSVHPSASTEGATSLRTDESSTTTVRSGIPSSSLSMTKTANPHHPNSPPSFLAKKLSTFCIETFAGEPHSNTTGRSSSSSSRASSPHSPPSLMLFTGPNATGNLPQRLQQRIAKRTTLLELDCPLSSHAPPLTATGGSDDALMSVAQPVDLVTSASVALYALRPNGEWDFQPERRSASSTQEGYHHPASPAMVRGSAGRLLPIRSKDLNWDYEEQVARAHAYNQRKIDRRQAKRMQSPHELWMKAEEDRIRSIANEERRRKHRPWESPIPEKAGADGLPDSVPDIIDDFRMPVDREVLHAEVEKSQTYVRPPNYDHRIIANNRR